VLYASAAWEVATCIAGEIASDVTNALLRMQWGKRNSAKATMGNPTELNSPTDHPQTDKSAMSSYRACAES